MTEGFSLSLLGFLLKVPTINLIGKRYEENRVRAVQNQTSYEITSYSLNVILEAKEIETDYSFYFEATEGISPKDVIWPKQGEQGCFVLVF